MEKGGFSPWSGTKHATEQTSECCYSKPATPADRFFCTPAFLVFFFTTFACGFVLPGAQNAIIKSLYIPPGLFPSVLLAAGSQSEVLLLRDDLLKSSCLKVPVFCLNSVSDSRIVIFQIKRGLLGESFGLFVQNVFALFCFPKARDETWGSADYNAGYFYS